MKRIRRPSSISSAINSYLIHPPPLTRSLAPVPLLSNDTNGSSSSSNDTSSSTSASNTDASAFKKVMDEDKERIRENTRILLRKAEVDVDGDIKNICKRGWIHVAGTKGKGSTCAMTESILRSLGLRTGLFTSPHLVDIRERVRINGELVRADVFEENFWAVWDAIIDDSNKPPLFFTFLFVVAMRIFAKQKEPLDVIILEVGIGGRLDATNAIDNPTACAITRIDLDHTELLGKTLPLIAREKAGIIKHGVPVFTPADQDVSVINVFKETCKCNSAKLHLVPALDPSNLATKSTANLSKQLGIAGSHQFENASVAIELARSVFPFEGIPEPVIKGLENCQWPGRCQKITQDGVDYYIDGAHTPASMEKCANWFVETVGNNETKKVLIFYCSHNRDVGHILDIVSKSCGEFEMAIFCPIRSHRPSLVAVPSVVDILSGIGCDQSIISGLKEEQKTSKSWHDSLSKVWSVIQPKSKYIVVDDIDAVSKVIKTTKLEESKNMSVLVTGSLLLVGDFLDCVLKWTPSSWNPKDEAPTTLRV